MDPSLRPRSLESPFRNYFKMLLIFLVFVGLLREAFGAREGLKRRLYGNESTELLEVFQVEAPLRKSYDDTSCKQVIMQHDFTASYGSPYVGP